MTKKAIYCRTTAFLFLVGMFWSPSPCLAQPHIGFRSNPDQVQINLPDQFADSVSMQHFFEEEIAHLRSRGYLLANIDSVSGQFPNTSFLLHIGQSYEITSLTIDNLPEDIRQKLENRPKKYLRKEYRADDINRMFHEIISYSENHGYPFAKASIDSVRVLGNSLHARLLYDPGPLITFDSIYTDATISKTSFLSAFTGVIPGKPYDERVIQLVPKRLSTLPYLSLQKPPRVSFSNETSQVHLFVKPEIANRIDGYIGFFPNSREGNQLLITGKIDLSLTNLFRSGKSLDLFWEKQQVATQKFEVTYLHPNLFHSPLGLVGNIDLYKQDSSFINRKILLGLSYLTGGYGTVRLFSRWESSRTTGNPSPEVVDFNLNNFGLQYIRTSKGFSALNNQDWEVDFTASIGNKELMAQSDDSLLLTLDPRTVQYTYSMHVAAQQLISRSFYLYGRVNAGLMRNSQLFLNDLFRVGGVSTIRGFYENEFYASEYLTGTLEARYYFSTRSNLIAFFDLGTLAYDLPAVQFQDSPYGFGLGTNIFTPGGTLSLNYALGKSATQPIDFKFAKIHIGYIASF